MATQSSTHARGKLLALGVVFARSMLAFRAGDLQRVSAARSTEKNPAQLRGVDLSGATLGRPSLAWANLAHANMSNIRVENRGDFADANLSHGWFDHVAFDGANLSHADLRDATIVHADLAHANLTGADLRGANVSFSHFRFSDLSGADLRGVAYIRLANFEGVRCSATTQWPSDFNPPACYRAAVYAADAGWVGGVRAAGGDAGGAREGGR